MINFGTVIWENRYVYIEKLYKLFYLFYSTPSYCSSKCKSNLIAITTIHYITPVFKLY